MEIRILKDHSVECRELQRRHRWIQGWMLTEEVLWRDNAGTRRGSHRRWFVVKCAVNEKCRASAMVSAEWVELAVEMKALQKGAKGVKR